MRKRLLLCLLALMMVFVLVACGSNGGSNEDSGTPEKPDSQTADDTPKEKGDFWLLNVDIPSKTKQISRGLVEGNDSVPVDLSKLDSSYTFTYRSNSASGDQSEVTVNSISEVKGSDWDGSVKQVAIKDSTGNTVHTLTIHSDRNGTKYDTFEDAIKNNSWIIDINEDLLFGKTFDYKTADGVNEIMENVFDLLGKPTHIYTREDSKLAMEKDEDIGQLPFVIEYEYDGFTLSVWIDETYNKPNDYRMLTYHGLVYNPEGMYIRMASFTKDILDEVLR